MTMLAKTTESRGLALADYEARIHLYKEQIGTGYIGIGRTLNEAKAAGVVPHGQWEEWVTKTTGLSPRNAQRCMQAATEIREGSAMAQLEMSKALMLLSSGLEAETREGIAEKAVEDGATVKALQEEIRKAKLRIVQEAGAATEMREALKKAQEHEEELSRQIRALGSGMQARIEEETGKAYQRGLQDKAAGMEAEIRKEYQGKIDALTEQKAQLEQVRKNLLEHANKVSDTDSKKIRELTAELEEQTRRAEDLQKDLDAAEEREARKAEQLEALKTEKTQRAMDSARGGVRSETPGALDLAAAVRAFIGAAGILPQMAPQIARMTESERSDISAQVETIAKWVENTRNALLFVAGDGTVD